MQRLELKAERDSVVVENLNASITEALEEKEQQKTTDGQHTFLLLDLIPSLFLTF